MRTGYRKKTLEEADGEGCSDESNKAVINKSKEKFSWSARGEESVDKQN